MTLPTPTPRQPLPSIRLRIAASLGWLAGSYSFVVSVSMIYLELTARHSFPTLFLLNGFFGVLCCWAAYLIWHRNKVGAILAIPIALFTTLGLGLSARFLTITFVLSVVALMLVLASWREFQWGAAA